MVDKIQAFLTQIESFAREYWTPQVRAFLRRPAATGFIADIMAMSGKSADEAVFVLLAAMRYIDSETSEGFYQPNILELPEHNVNLELFLVRHQQALFELCCRRRVQANVPARGLAIMDALCQGYPNTPCAVLELGASHGLLGRVLCNPSLMNANSGFFPADQQYPTQAFQPAIYLGIDPDPPELNWLMACIPLHENRQRLVHFIKSVPAGDHCQVIRALAQDIAQLPDVEAFIAKARIEQRMLVVLSSFLRFELDPPNWEKLCGIITQFCAAQHAVWVNIDIQQTDPPRFVLEMDRKIYIELDSDICLSWQKGNI